MGNFRCVDIFLLCNSNYYFNDNIIAKFQVVEKRKGTTNLSNKGNYDSKVRIKV